MNTLPRSERYQSEQDTLDDRSPFERDRDRLLYSAHFRRLGAVTQITSPIEVFIFHTRLTHTLEVSQICRRMAERLLRRCDTSESRALLSMHIDPNVCEVASLIHDLGHPPFGHNGEVCLDTISRDTHQKVSEPALYNDGFCGNAQSFRIVTKIATRTSEIAGLNLTRATLLASLKYPMTRTITEEDDKLICGNLKFGVYLCDTDIYRWLTKPEDTEAKQFSDARNIEAQLMDWADDVAYSTSDVLDFGLAGLIPINELKLLARKGVEQSSSKEMQSVISELRHKLAEMGKDLSDVDDNSFEKVLGDLAWIPDIYPMRHSIYRSDIVGSLKQWVSARIAEFSDVNLEVKQRSDGQHELVLDPLIVGQVKILKALAYCYAIKAPSLEVQQEGERHVLKHLYNVFIDDASNGGKKFFSIEMRHQLKNGSSAVRATLDAISTMTDAQALSTYGYLTGMSFTSVLESVVPRTL